MAERQSAFTLGDLLAQEDLGLELLSGGEPALARRLAGAHAIEVERPSTWLERDWVMLTTGVRLRHHPDGQRLLMVELEAAGVAAPRRAAAGRRRRARAGGARARSGRDRRVDR